MKYQRPTILLLIATTLFAVILHEIIVTKNAVAALSCSVATSCASGIVIYNMSSTTNAHAELPSQANYSQLVCCTGVTGLSNSCSATFATVLKLSSTTNAHAEQGTLSNYSESACLSVPAGGSASVAYQPTNCSGYDTTLGSMSSATNAHVGNSAAYSSLQICASAAAAQSLTFSISDNTIGFGALTSSGGRYATGGTGNTREVIATQFLVSTNASTGYTVTMQGATLTSGSYTVDAIGNASVATSTGIEQFGMRITGSGGVGAVTSPYAGGVSGLEYAFGSTDTTPVEVARATTGDGAVTTYSPRFVANISPTTEQGDYTAYLVFVVTGNF